MSFFGDIIKAARIGWRPPVTTLPSLPPVGNAGGTPLPLHLAAAPLKGFRSWMVTSTPDGFALRSIYTRHVWTSADITAVCYPQSGCVLHETSAPYVDGACGVYSQKGDEPPLWEWEHQRRSHIAATGTIAMWGRIIECERGWKAQHARILDPIVLEASCAYNCYNHPTRVELPAGSGGLMSTFCDAHIPEYRGPTVVVELGLALREVAAQLADRYKVDVFHF